MKYKIAPDKWRHFWAGIPLGILCQVLANWMYEPPLWKAILMAFLAVAVVSYGFELFSKITGLGIYDFIDAVASVIGGLLGMAVVLLIYSVA